MEAEGVVGIKNQTTHTRHTLRPLVTSHTAPPGDERLANSSVCYSRLVTVLFSAAHLAAPC